MKGAETEMSSMLEKHAEIIQRIERLKTDIVGCDYPNIRRYLMAQLSELYGELRKLESVYTAPQVIYKVANDDKMDAMRYSVDGIIRLQQKGFWEKLGDNMKKVNKAEQDNAHYKQGKMQPIEYMEKNFSEEELRGAYKFNIVKYVSRFQYKDGLKDLDKAKDYLERLIRLVDKCTSKKGEK